jgi:hypothetical protein
MSRQTKTHSKRHRNMNASSKPSLGEYKKMSIAHGNRMLAESWTRFRVASGIQRNPAGLGRRNRHSAMECGDVEAGCEARVEEKRDGQAPTRNLQGLNPYRQMLRLQSGHLLLLTGLPLLQNWAIQLQNGPLQQMIGHLPQTFIPPKTLRLMILYTLAVSFKCQFNFVLLIKQNYV